MKKPTINYAALNNTKIVASSPTTVNNFKRLVAYIIDWYAASMLAGIPVVLIYSIFFKDLEITQNITLLPMPYSILSGLIAIGVYLAYFIIIPLKVYPGQTLAKKIMNIKVVKNDDSDVDLITLIKREVLGVMIVEGYIAASSSYFHQIINILIGQDLNQVYTYLFGIITALSILWACASPQRKMFHDYIAKTKLVITQDD